MNARDVFINCPFTPDYQDHFHAIVFVIIRSGFTPRCARENDDGGEIRFDKICRIIAECPYGIHDISKTELDPASHLPRFNMPLELGLFLGAKKFGTKNHKSKKALILDREPYRYQKFISDIAGQDVHAHSGKVTRLIEEVATWLREEAHDPNVPGGRAIASEYARFKLLIPKLCAALHLELEEVTFKDFEIMTAKWIASTKTIATA